MVTYKFNSYLQSTYYDAGINVQFHINIVLYIPVYLGTYVPV